VLVAVQSTALTLGPTTRLQPRIAQGAGNVLLAASLAAALTATPNLAAATLPNLEQPPSAIFLVAADEELPSTTATAPAESAAPAPAADDSTAKPAPTELSYIELKALLKDCQDGAPCRVSKVDFMDALGESGIAYVDAVPLTINDIPKDDPSNDSSPYKLMAKCRDAKVPYSFPFTRVMREQQATRPSTPAKDAEVPSPSFSIPPIEMPKLPSFSLPF